MKSNAAWYRALAYVKISGANLFSAENRLPKRCEVGCMCNTRTWSQAGYRPAGLQTFYDRQHAIMNYNFPGKTRSYALIQDGFPRVDDGGGYVDENGAYVDGNGAAAPNAEIGQFKQTQDIIDKGQADWTTSFAVQHNGLQPRPPDCAILGNPGCPNKWVVAAGANGTIGFQTQNIKEIDDNALLEAALDNGYANSNATFIEIYEERSWEARIEGALDPSLPAHTLAGGRTAFTPAGLGSRACSCRSSRSRTLIRRSATPAPRPIRRCTSSTAPSAARIRGAWGKIVIHP